MPDRHNLSRVSLITSPSIGFWNPLNSKWACTIFFNIVLDMAADIRFYQKLVKASDFNSHGVSVQKFGWLHYVRKVLGMQKACNKKGILNRNLISESLCGHFLMRSTCRGIEDASCSNANVTSTILKFSKKFLQNSSN